MSGNAHVPVLLRPVLEGLKVKPDGLYVDGTFGRGGHSRAILDELNDKGRLFAIDRDPAAIAAAPGALLADSRFDLAKGEIAQIASCIAEKYDTSGDTGTRLLDGLLLDLGVSSPQLDEADRGFSFRRDGPLDMRMDPSKGQSAAEWLAEVDAVKLKNTLKRYGEEAFAARIAREIVSSRENAPIRTTGELANIVFAAVPGKARAGKKHPATKSFQAIRIEINDELKQIEAALEQSLTLLKKGGRLCVISFHSLEDRIVKRFIRNHSREPEQYRGMPNIPEECLPALQLIGKPIVASIEEIAANVRARSARLRVAERT